MKPYHLDPVQFEAMIHHAEQTAKNWPDQKGRMGAACRISAACVRPLYETLRRELERGTDPENILQGFQPVLSNIFGSLIHVCEANANAVPIMQYFCTGLIAETIKRLELIEDDNADPDLVRTVQQAKGQRT